ncbi:MAG: protease inhibitor I42 family protein [Acidimicrobiales bacterium]|nr:protease inhibitor I42 family protein [Acidimicrobiales bacterium]RZV48791.1 MAG: hypothetical protein EX269_00420 [Acidimicrobiales bacterium]
MRVIILLLVVVFSLTVACSDGDDLVVTDADSTSELLVSAGDQFEVRLESNPGTGYAWGVSEMTTPLVVELQSQDFVAPADGEAVGAPGTDVFVFEVADSGAGILRLEYLRSFDDPPVPERVVEYIIRIDEAPWPPARDDSQPPSTASATAPVQVSDLFNGDGARDATVRGFVVWDENQARLCEVLMESFPPQCGGEAVVISNPEQLDVELETEGAVRWTQGFVEIAGSFDGEVFVVE